MTGDIMRKIFLLVLSSILLCSLFNNSVVYASSELDDVTSNFNNEVLDSSIETRSAGSVTLTPDKYIHKYVWKKVKDIPWAKTPTPALKVYHHVIYQNGHRYEGDMAWTGAWRGFDYWGERRVEFQFHGNLMLTD
ncbi:hypothetical protein [Facklamia sp. P9177]|uniref:hypothetical protein n=1 Tax=Facklamia sp. P9177 TaxID=3421945 RepID=UPI003D17F9C9